MAVQSPTQLFLEEMGSMYSAEQIMLQTLPQLAKESNNQQATNDFQMHEQETMQQVHNLCLTHHVRFIDQAFIRSHFEVLGLACGFKVKRGQDILCRILLHEFVVLLLQARHSIAGHLGRPLT